MSRAAARRTAPARPAAVPIVALVLALSFAAAAPHAQPAALPLLTEPVHDFAGVLDPAAEAELARRIRALHRATGDAIVVVTVETFAPYADIREYAVKLFENHGRGIGERGKDNGLLIVVAVKDRRVAIEVGYGLEEIVPDGYAGEIVRAVLIPAFRTGDYGGGLLAAVTRIATRIAERRGVRLEDVPAARRERAVGVPWPFLLFLLFVVLVLALSGANAVPRRRGRYWTRGPWSGWSSGVGPFGMGPFGGGFGGFGGSGAFGGFGGGRSGGGGAAGGW
jgi:uncharacterized protein